MRAAFAKSRLFFNLKSTTRMGTTHTYAIYHSPIGYIRIERRGERLTQLHILDSKPAESGSRDLFTDRVFDQLMEYLRGERTRFDISIDIDRCTPFQQSVLRELQRIPYAETRSYKEIATAVGNADAARAVGMANNRNPIHIIIPCHRVVGSRGEITGYAAGVGVKSYLLELEQMPHSR